MNLNPDDIRRLAKFTLETKPYELNCEEWVHRVGEYVEADPEQVASEPRLQQVEKHVESCAFCAQELDLLRGLLRDRRAD